MNLAIAQVAGVIVHGTTPTTAVAGGLRSLRLTREWLVLQEFRMVYTAHLHTGVKSVEQRKCTATRGAAGCSPFKVDHLLWSHRLLACRAFDVGPLLLNPLIEARLAEHVRTRQYERVPHHKVANLADELLVLAQRSFDILRHELLRVDPDAASCLITAWSASRSS